MQTRGANEQHDEANGDDEGAQPGVVMAFLGVLVVGIVAFVALLYGFFWPMWAGS